MSLQLDSIIYFVPCIFSLIISDYHYLFQSNTMVPLVRTPCSFWENQRKILQKEKKKESGSNLICRYGRSSHWINRPYSSRVSFCAKRKSWTLKILKKKILNLRSFAPIAALTQALEPETWVFLGETTLALWHWIAVAMFRGCVQSF